MKTAIIGAAGEIGARLTQAMLTDGESVRAISRKKSPRLARWGNLDFVASELPVSGAELEKALSGCSAVVNCVVDKKPFESDDVSIRSNEQELRNLIETAIKLGVEKFIHLSTIAVLPPKLTQAGVQTPFDYSKETDWYSRVKIATEKIALEYKSQIKLCVVRPGIVYGPYMFWSRVAFQRIQNFKVVLPAVENSSCHAIHVDDLCGLCRQLLQFNGKLPELLHGINPEHVTWKSYYELHANALGFYDDIISEQSDNSIRAHHVAQKRAEAESGTGEQTLEQLRKFYRELPDVLINNPFSKKAVETMKVWKRGLPFYTKLLLPPPKAGIFPNEFELELYSTTGLFSPGMTGADQGYAYRVPFSEGVRSAAAWWNFEV